MNLINYKCPRSEAQRIQPCTSHMDLTGFALTKVFEPVQPARKRRSDCLYLPSADGNEDVEIEVNCACLGFQKYNQNGIRFGPNGRGI
jgi:hypothetical protein